MRFAHDELTGSLNIVAPRRALRLPAASQPGCPFCPGAEDATPPEIDRVVKDQAHGWQVRTVPNLFPLAERHEVHILTDRHVTSTRELTLDEWSAIVEMWCRRLEVRPTHQHSVVHLFMNDGRGAGASMDHLHSQLVEVPPTPRSQLVHDANRGSTCAACTLVRSHDELKVWESENLQIKASDAPAASGHLLLLPTEHETSPAAHAVEELAEALYTLCRVSADGDRNLWFSVSADRASHWFVTLLPRTATLAGVELGLGVGVSLIEPREAAASARERV